MLFVFVGSGVARKGLHAAVAAVSRTPYWLAVVGKDRFKGEAGKRVRFLGGRDDVRPYYAAADCLVLPTRYDPFPNTVLEAMAMGLPVIVSSRCGAAEVIEPGVNGWVCEPDDVPGLVRAMHEAEEAGSRAGAAARATAERFGIDDMAKELVNLYKTLAK